MVDSLALGICSEHTQEQITVMQVIENKNATRINETSLMHKHYV